MVEISLEGMEFFAYHGFYQEEQIIGNKYSLDIKVEINNNFLNEDLDSSVNYEVLYALAKERMKLKSKLLETFANELIEQIFLQFPNIKKAIVSISKHNPPIGGICKVAKVTITKDR